MRRDRPLAARARVRRHRRGGGPGPARTAQGSHPVFECGHLRSIEWLPELRRAVAPGAIDDPNRRRIPPIAPRSVPAEGPPCPVKPEPVHPFEDAALLLLTSSSDAELSDLMAEAANHRLATGATTSTSSATG